MLCKINYVTKNIAHMSRYGTNFIYWTAWLEADSELSTNSEPWLEADSVL